MPPDLLRTVIAAVAVAAVAVLSGCGGSASGPGNGRGEPTVTVEGKNGPGPDRTGSGGSRSDRTGPAGAHGQEPVEALPERLPGLGPKTLARIPEDSRQALVVTGEHRNSPESTAVLHERTDAGWRAGPVWPAHNALRGWTDDHRAGDLRSPAGVYTLTDAGGRLPAPGTALPYDHSDGFTIGGTGFEDEPLAGSFDYVVAIDYNREPGTSPLDRTRPQGAAKGGGIWLHVDHDGPTQGCVSLGRAHMKDLLRALDPDLRPVVVMGDAGHPGRG